jgi:hypothetical protein
MTPALYIPTENGPYAVEPNATVALAHARKLRGLGMGFCLTPDKMDGWYAVTGKSGALTVLQIDADPSPSLGLPALAPTWTVRLPGLRQLWFKPPFTGDGALLPVTHKRSGVTVLRHAPLPGTRHDSGEAYEWDADFNPWTMPIPATLPLEWWQALPKLNDHEAFIALLTKPKTSSYK